MGNAGTDSFSNFTKFLGSTAADKFTIAHTDTTSYDLKGNGGADTFIVGNGNVTIDGGPGANGILSFGNATQAVTTTLSGASAGSGGGADSGINKFTNIKTFIGGSGGDTFNASADTGPTTYTYSGGTGKDSLTGSSGNDTLLGGNGDDTLTGGAGNDSLVAWNGNDSLVGGVGDDTLDLRTNNTSLVGDSANGGAGNDTIIISQDKLGFAGFNLDGGTTPSTGADDSNDTLVVYKGTATASLNLTSLNATNFETLDVATDTSSTTVLLSSAGIQSLVNNGDNSILTLKLGTTSTNDAYTFSLAAGETHTLGQNLKFFDASNHQIAQVNFTYV